MRVAYTVSIDSGN